MDPSSPTLIVARARAPVEPAGAGVPTHFRAYVDAWVAALSQALRDQSWFVYLSALYLLTAFTVARAYDQTLSLGLYGAYHLGIYANFVSAIVIVRIVWVLLRHRPARPFHAVAADLRERVFSRRRICMAAPVFFLLPLVLSAMTSLKRMIPVIAPFDWDYRLMALDRFLHGGYHPWELLQPLLGYPLVTVAISYLYTIPWLIMVLFLQFWHTVTLEPGRMRFLLSYVLSWFLLGNGLATAFSSAGPAYYHHFVTGANPFAPLMDYLYAVAADHRLPSVMGQEYLWSSYEQNFAALGSGMSAMPSMHIATAFLAVLVCWRRHPVLRWGSISFLLLLLAGSVHLGWHYAVDGYVSVALTGAIWVVVGRALRWRETHVAHAASINT